MVGVIIIVVFIILYMLLSSLQQDSRPDKKAPRIETKYHTLISNLLKTPDAEISSTVGNRIEISINSKLIRSQIILLSAGVDLHVWWHMITPEGRVDENWKFPEHLDQQKMFEKISSDIEFKLNSIWNIPTQSELLELDAQEEEESEVINDELSPFEDFFFDEDIVDQYNPNKNLEELSMKIIDELDQIKYELKVDDDYLHGNVSKHTLKEHLELVNKLIKFEGPRAKTYRKRGVIQWMLGDKLAASKDWLICAEMDGEIFDLMYLLADSKNESEDNLPF